MQYSCLKFNSILWIDIVNFDVIDKPLSRYIIFVRYWKEMRVHYLFIYFQKYCGSH